MADFFGNGFWAIRYFPAGYWGLDGEQPAGAISATISGQASVSAEISYTTTAASVLSGGKVRRLKRVLSWPRFEPLHLVTLKHGQAKASGFAVVSATMSASGPMSASVTGKTTLIASATAKPVYSQDVEFWLMAA